MTSVVNFLKNHKNKIILGGLGLGAFYYMYNNTNENEEELKKKRITQYLKNLFKNNEETADTAVTTFLPQICKVITEMFSLEKLQEQIKNPNVSSEEKKKTWEEIKNITFSRIILGMYSLVFTNVFLSIQVFMIGRYLFLQYVDEKESEQLQSGSQQEFLSFFADHFPKEGIQKLNEIISKNLKDKLETISLKKELDKTEVKELFKELRSECEQDVLKNLSNILLPNEKFEPIHDFSKNLLNEARDMIESQEFSIVLISCLNTVFELFDKKIDFIIKSLLDEKKKYMANFTGRLVHELKDIFEGDYFIALKQNYDFRSYSLIVFSLGIQL